MARITLPTKRQVGHLTLHRQGRKLSLQEYNSLQPSERLDMIRKANGKQKYDLLLNAVDAEQLAPQLHPQEIYLTVNEVGPEYAVELLMLADAGQITTLLDLDCWEGDNLSPALSLHWLSLILETGTEKVIQLAQEIEPELLVLFLKKHLTILRGLEAYDDDDAENARRMESIYDIEYSSEEAQKIIAAFLLILAQEAQGTYLLLMEMVRSELTSVLEEEVFQERNKRLLDLGFVPRHEARSLYAFLDPESLITGDKIDFSVEAEGFQHPGALLAQAEPHQFLAEILSNNSSYNLAAELCLLANRKMSADQTDMSSSGEVAKTLQSLYDTLNLALEYLAGRDLARAEKIFRTSYLSKLFQLGHSLLLKRQQRAQKLLDGPIGPHLDYLEQLFLNALIENPPAHYLPPAADKPSDLQSITTLKDLELVDLRLQQVEDLQRLFVDKLPFNLPDPAEECEEAPSLSALLLTAVANQLLGRSFAPVPLAQKDLLVLKAKTLKNDQLIPEFSDRLPVLIKELGINCSSFVEFCLECWQEDLGALNPEQLGSCFPISLLLQD